MGVRAKPAKTVHNPSGIESTDTKRGQVPSIGPLPSKEQDLSNYLDLATLSERQRECFSLRFEYGLATSEIARRLGISPKVVGKHIKAANRKLQSAQANERRAKHKFKSVRPSGL